MFKSLHSVCLLAGAFAVVAGAQDDPALLGRVVHSKLASDIRDQVRLVGDVGSNAYDEIGATTRIEGSVLSAGKVYLRSSSLVTGDVNAVGAITSQQGASVVGTKTSPATVATIDIDATPVTAGTGTIWVNSGEIRTLPAGSYGYIGANAGSTVRLSTGTYDLNTLDLQPGVVLQIDVSAGPVRVNLSNTANFGDRSSIAIVGGDASDVRFHSVGTSVFRIGTDVKFHGVVSAPNSEIHVYSRTKLSGALWGNRVVIEPQVEMIGDFPTPPATGSISGAVLNGYRGDVHSFFTADNHYMLFHGRSNGSELVLAGHNELSEVGNPGASNWSVAEEYNFNVGPDDHLYIIAWDYGVERMWSGHFDLNGSSRIVSDRQNWEYVDASAANPGRPTLPGFALPTTESVAAEITAATAGNAWKPLAVEAPQGTYPWGVIANVDPNAMFVWSDMFAYSPIAGDDPTDHYQIFRSKAPVIPRVAVPTWTVYIDANNNGQLDAGERSTTTDANSAYTFDKPRHRHLHGPSDPEDRMGPSRTRKRRSAFGDRRRR